MAAETTREWVEFECYGPLWQPGFDAWKEFRVSKSPVPFGEWDEHDAALAVAMVPDLSGVTDWRATWVRETHERLVTDSEDVERVNTYRRLIREFSDPEAAMTMFDACHPEWDEVG